MVAFDGNQPLLNRPIRPDPKPEGGKKKPKSSSAKSATKPAEKARAEINNRNRNFGKSIEREVAKRTGGERTPGSGAIKNSVKNLEGDVRVRDADNRRDIIVIECKGSSGLTPSGDKSFTLKKSVLEQMVNEAEIVGAIGALFIHWKHEEYDTDFVVIRSDHFYRLVELARKGATLDG